MPGVGIVYQVADVAHPIMGVAKACDNGPSVLFSPNGSFIVPGALSLPEGVASVPLLRQDNLFWMRGRIAGGAATPHETLRLNPIGAEAPVAPAPVAAGQPLHEEAPLAEADPDGALLDVDDPDLIPLTRGRRKKPGNEKRSRSISR